MGTSGPRTLTAMPAFVALTLLLATTTLVVVTFAMAHAAAVGPLG